MGRAARVGSKAARIRPARMLMSRSSSAFSREPGGLLGLAAQGLDHHRAVEGLVGDLAELGAQLLRLGHQRGGEALVGHVGEHHRGEDQQPDQGQHHVGEEHLRHGDHHHRQHADRHRQRRDRAPRRLDVGVGVGQQLAGRVAVVPLHREREVLPGHLPAGVGLHAVLHDTRAEPARHDADRAQQRDAEEEREDRDHQAGPDLTVLEGGQDDVVGRPAEHPGVGDRERAEQDAADRREREDPRLATDRHPEDPEPLDRGPAPAPCRSAACLAHYLPVVVLLPAASGEPAVRSGYSPSPTSLASPGRRLLSSA